MDYTTKRLLEKYNSYRRRNTVSDPIFKKYLFTSYTRTLGSWLPIDLNTKILDIACGEGSFLFYLKEKGYANLSGIDYSPENVDICQNLGLKFVIEGDALDINRFYQEEQFGQIYILDFLEHIKMERVLSFLESVKRKVTPGGVMIIQTPNMGSLFGLYHRYNDISHEIGFTEKSIIDLMLMGGFKMQDISIKPAWNAATFTGRVRELYLRLLHRLIYLAEDSSRSIIPTKNLLIKGIVR